MASAFVLVASVFTVRQLWDKMSHPFVKKEIVVLVLLAVAVAGTMLRNMMWKSGAALYRDMVAQSPHFSLVRALYGFALVDQGDLEGARAQFSIANVREGSRVPFQNAPHFIDDTLGYWEDGDLGLAYILEREGKQAEAARRYERILARTNGKSEKAVRRLVPIYVEALAHEGSIAERNRIKSKLIYYTGKKYKYTDAHTIYLIGKILLLPVSLALVK